MERYCSNCGNALGMNDPFCSGCGSPTHESARIPTSNVDVPQPEKIGLAQGVFFGVSFLVLLVSYILVIVLPVGCIIAIISIFILGVLTGSNFITFAGTAVVLLIYLAIAALCFIGFVKSF